MIKGDEDYLKTKGTDPENERNKIKLQSYLLQNITKIF